VRSEGAERDELAEAGKRGRRETTSNNDRRETTGEKRPAQVRYSNAHMCVAAQVR